MILRAARLGGVVALVAVAAPARAGEAPPPLALPPAVAPYDSLTAPTRESLDALERSGRQKRIGGAVLMATGSTLAAIGAGLAIAGASGDSSCAWYYDDQHGTHHISCVDGRLTFAGGTTLLVGIGLLIPGAVVYVGGNREVERARAWRRSFFPRWSARPRVGTGGAGVDLSTSF